MQEVDVVILGAGAAGLMCAIEAGRRGRRVVVLDHADRAGKKILISGGGRSNFTNLHCRPENFLSENPHFAKSALSCFTPTDMIAFVEEHNISYHEKTLGQLFCDRSAQDLVNALERDCADANVHVALETRVKSVHRTAGSGARFRVETSAEILNATSVVVATGGLSIPKMGATGFGYELAAQFGIRVVEPRAALVPFTFSAEDRERWCELAGVSTEVVTQVNSRLPTPRAKTKGAPSFREKMLITHRGLSGPAMLQISSFWSPGEALKLDLAPDKNIFAPLLAPHARRDRAAALVVLRGLLPARWAERWLSLCTEDAGLGQETQGLTNAAIAALEQRLHAWRVIPAGTEGYAKAEVTAGGVDTAELHAKTLESRRHPGLYFIGEVVDVTGWLGGFNFQWAWASGFCAGQVA